MMDDETLQLLLLRRNARETTPFVAVHDANASLLSQVDALQAKCEALEIENATQQRLIEEVSSGAGTTGPGSGKGGTGSNTATAALRNEARLRDKVEKLQENLNEKLRLHQEETNKALKTARDLADMKETAQQNERLIVQLQKERDEAEKKISHLLQKVEDAQSTTRLAEKQYMGLKDTIRTLQEENDVLKKENGVLIERVISEKEKASDEMNELTEMVEKLKKEVDMLRELKVQEDKRKGWFGTAKGRSGKSDEDSGGNQDDEAGRKFGSHGVVVPSAVKRTIDAHYGEATCVR